MVKSSNFVDFPGDKPNRYGYQRMFGALGWGLLSLLAGVLVDVMSDDEDQPNYSICFYLAAVILVVDFVVSSRLQVSLPLIEPVAERQWGQGSIAPRVLLTNADRVNLDQK